ncbi:hypothetical protein DEI92_03190 [Curtobacterium sp. MCBD17_034]|uniref:DUF4012 domain-containing protein n=1 Tax=unclassified Curtobacterium TaxID=257496 RepID=UPI000DAA020D|nr:MULTISPECIES: DUF4012 domain-containing protein [unclassified Curtobacterium]PZF62497.1 hypothetical protein DEI92_03190 [Curtobacterium sp. MCBD17_034]PZM39794.1 hypothetical protein DEI90_02920 [Curtobacterium sp. MCBD17_031]
MSDPREAHVASSAEPSRSRRPLRIAVTALVAIVVLSFVWVGVRGFLAERDLRTSMSLVSEIKADVASGKGEQAKSAAEQLEQRAASASRLTSDPIWRTYEHAPFLGSNLRAIRQIAAITDAVATGAVRPAVSVLSGFNAASLAPKSGKVDLSPLVKAQEPITKAAGSLRGALRSADAIDAGRTISPVESAVDQLRTALQSASEEAAAADHVVRLAPDMLGAAGPKRYLLLFENNAELRSGGGIPGAVALLHTDDGAISLERQASSSDFPKAASPVLPLPVDAQGLYGAITGEYIQDVTLTPRFSTSAKLVRAMWKQKYGEDVDGVLSLDPVTLGYILKATGPVTLPTGDTLSSSNAVPLLLSQVYARYPDNAEQDEFFAAAAVGVFEKIATGAFDPSALVAALTRGADEGRVKLWSEDAHQEQIVKQTPVSGALPASDDSTARFGVYLNDATGAKMDYYLTKQIAVGSKVCRADGRPTWTVQVTLKNTAPADAATSLPRYVTGGGDFGVSPGNVGTNVAIYAPRTGVFLSASQDGKAASPQTALDGRYPVVQIPTLLSPGQSTTLTVQFLGPKAAAGHTVAAESTPGVHQTVTRPVDVTCESR